mgnify:FL=1
MSQEHQTFSKTCDRCQVKIFMRWSENKQRYYPANNETGKPDFHNCSTQQVASPPQNAPTKQVELTTPTDELSEKLAYAFANALKIRAVATKLVDSIKTDIQVDERGKEIMIEHYENILTQLLKGS